jgi:hypothetical protein
MIEGGSRAACAPQVRPGADVLEEAIGVLSECLQALYGIHRLLGARDVGPGQLLPMLTEFGGGVADHCARVGLGCAELRRLVAHDSALLGVLDWVLPFAEQAGSRMSAAFAGPLKLGAAERLELERACADIGPRAEALRDTLVLVNALLRPRPVALTLRELACGRWAASSTFVERVVPLGLAWAPDQRLEVDPAVLWPLVTRAVSSVATEGQASLVSLDTLSGRPCLAVARVATLAAADHEMELALGVSLAHEAEVLDVVATRAGVRVSRERSDLVTLWP